MKYAVGRASLSTQKQGTHQCWVMYVNLCADVKEIHTLQNIKGRVCRYSSIYIVTRLRVGRPRNRGSIPGRGNFSPLQSSQTLYLNGAGKSLPRTVNKICKDLNAQDWIPHHQFGFKQAHFTVQQCHRITDVINKTMENKQYCTAAFLDVS